MDTRLLVHILPTYLLLCVQFFSAIHVQVHSTSMQEGNTGILICSSPSQMHHGIVLVRLSPLRVRPVPLPPLPPSLPTRPRRRVSPGRGSGVESTRTNETSSPVPSLGDNPPSMSPARDQSDDAFAEQREKRQQRREGGGEQGERSPLLFRWHCYRFSASLLGPSTSGNGCSLTHSLTHSLAHSLAHIAPRQGGREDSSSRSGTSTSRKAQRSSSAAIHCHVQVRQADRPTNAHARVHTHARTRALSSIP